MPIFSALFLVILAGVINGSFALPTKYMPKWHEENTWLIFAFWGFLLIPWISMLAIEHRIMTIFISLPWPVLWEMLLGGVLFGIGQICFAFALRLLGLGLAFVINIGLGTAGSALLPLILWHQDKLPSPYGYAIYVGVLLFLLGVILAAIADRARAQAKPITTNIINILTKKKLYKFLGILLGILAGVGSTCQAVTYIYVNPTIVAATQNSFHLSNLTAYNIAWLGIFSGAFLPYMLYFLILNIKNHGLKNYLQPGTKLYWFTTLVMGLFFWMSLVLFSKAAQIIGSNLAPIIAWPMFMIFIILTSNFWGFIAKEWQGCGTKAKSLLGVSILLLIIAVFVFAYANSLNVSIVSLQQHLGAHVKIMR